MELLVKILVCFLAGAGAGIGTGFPGIHPPLLPLHCDHRCHRRRGRVEMGHGCRGLQHGAGVGRSMGGLPPFHVALTWGGRTLRSGVSASRSQPS